MHILKFEVQRSTSASLEHPTSFPAFGTIIWRQQPSEGNSLPRPCWAFAGLAYVDELSAEDQFATSHPIEVEQFLILVCLQWWFICLLTGDIWVSRLCYKVPVLLISSWPHASPIPLASTKWNERGYFPSFSAIFSSMPCHPKPSAGLEKTALGGIGPRVKVWTSSGSLRQTWSSTVWVWQPFREVRDKMLRVWLWKMKGGHFIENWFWIFSHFSEGVAFYKEIFWLVPKG